MAERVQYGIHMRNHCTHNSKPIQRIAHGFLGDAPAGTVQNLCPDCGTQVGVQGGIVAVPVTFSGIY